MKETIMGIIVITGLVLGSASASAGYWWEQRNCPGQPQCITPPIHTPIEE